MALSRAKTFEHPKKTPALQASVVSAVHNGFDSNRLSVKNFCSRSSDFNSWGNKCWRCKISQLDAQAMSHFVECFIYPRKASYTNRSRRNKKAAKLLSWVCHNKNHTSKLGASSAARRNRNRKSRMKSLWHPEHFGYGQAVKKIVLKII